MKKRSAFPIAIDILIAILVPIVWLSTMFVRGEAGTLEPVGFRGLRFFTVLSNLVAGLASQIYLLSRIKRGSSTGDEEIRKTASLPASLPLKLKLISAVAVAITFFTVLLFLGPLYGYRYMYTGSNLFFHLLIPLLTMIGVTLTELEVQFTKKDILLTALPVLIYGVLYIGNILVNGIGEWPNTNDWYGFLNWGYLVGILIFVVLIGISITIGAAISKIRNLLQSLQH